MTRATYDDMVAITLEIKERSRKEVLAGDVGGVGLVDSSQHISICSKRDVFLFYCFNEDFTGLLLHVELLHGLVLLASADV